MRSKNYVFNDNRVLRFDYAPEEISQINEKAKKNLETKISEIIKIPAEKRTFKNTVASFESALARYSEIIDPMAFMTYVSPNEKVREAANKLEGDVGKYLVEMFTREEIYKAVAEYADKKEKLSAIDAKLLKEMIRDFKRNGMALSSKDKIKYKRLKNKLIDYKIKFGKLAMTMALIK